MLKTYKYIKSNVTHILSKTNNITLNLLQEGIITCFPLLSEKWIHSHVYSGGCLCLQVQRFYERLSGWQTYDRGTVCLYYFYWEIPLNVGRYWYILLVYYSPCAHPYSRCWISFKKNNYSISYNLFIIIT